MKSNAGLILEKQFLNTINEYGLINKNDKIIIGLSGGADSVLLAFFFKIYSSYLEISPKITVCHINHSLRGIESVRDASFCQEFSEKYGFEFILKEIDVKSHAGKEKLSIELAARNLRYQAFQEALIESGSQKFATAHNLDDLSETMLYRIFKGTGLSGLIAIPVKRDCFIRPFLFSRKQDIVNYLKTSKIGYVEDSSNLNKDYDRNYIRHSLITVIEKRFPGFRRKIGELYRIAYEEEKLWHKQLDGLKKFIEISGGEICLKKQIFMEEENIPVSLIRRFIRSIIRDMVDVNYYPNLGLINKIIESGKNYNGNKIIHRTKMFIIVSSYKSVIFHKVSKIFPNPAKYVKLNGTINFDFMGYRISIEPVVSRLDQYKADSKDKLFYCFINIKNIVKLKIRSRNDGDRIRIKDNKSKKLKDIFIDRKLNYFERSKTIIFEAKLDNSDSIIAFFIPDFGFRVSEDFYIKSVGENIVWRISIIDD